MHTQEPWIDRDDEDCTHPIIDIGKEMRLQYGIAGARLMSQEDYDRARICVNLLAGISSQMLDMLLHTGGNAWLREHLPEILEASKCESEDTKGA